MLTGSQAQDIYTTLRGDFQKGIEEAEPIASPLYETVTSGGESNLYGWFSHLPGFTRWNQGEPRKKRNLKQNNYRVPNLRFEDTIAISEDDVNDDQLKQFRPAVKSMGKVGALLDDELVFDMFNYGFTGTTGDGDDVKAYDGQPWFADSHTVGVSTIDNKSTAALTTSSYATAYETLTSYTAKADNLGKARPLARGFKLMLVIPPTLLSDALDIVGVQLLSGGGTNKWYNTAEILMSPYLTSTTAWFLVNVGSIIKPIFVQDREKLQIVEKTPGNDSDAFMYDEIIVGAKRRLNALVTYPWLAYGSTGAST